MSSEFNLLKKNSDFNRDLPDNIEEEAEEGDLEMPKIYEPVSSKSNLTQNNI